MALKDWKEKLRHITSAIISAVGDLHAPRPPAARLAAATADAFHLQERVNTALEDALKHEREWRKAAEHRIGILEDKLDNVVNPSASEEVRLTPITNAARFVPEDTTSSNGITTRTRPSCKKRAQMGQQFSAQHSPRKKKRESEQNNPIDDNEYVQSKPTAKRKGFLRKENTPSGHGHETTSRTRPSCKKRAQMGQQFAVQRSSRKKRRGSGRSDLIVDDSFARSSPYPDRGVDEGLKNCEDLQGIPRSPKVGGLEYKEEEPTVEGRSKRVRAEQLLPVTPPRKTLPPLPTLKDVEQDWARRRAEMRAREQYKPPPCDKCRLRKRALMLRQHGYVKEEVFERWAKKPGACLEYMHQDEDNPMDQRRSPLTFDETETQSP